MMENFETPRQPATQQPESVNDTQAHATQARPAGLSGFNLRRELSSAFRNEKKENAKRQEEEFEKENANPQKEEQPRAQKRSLSKLEEPNNYIFETPSNKKYKTTTFQEQVQAGNAGYNIDF